MNQTTYTTLLLIVAEVQKKTWIASADSCILANFEEVNKMKRQYTDSWIGGYYETTPWMEYLGMTKFYCQLKIFDKVFL